MVKSEFRNSNFLDCIIYTIRNKVWIVPKATVSVSAKSQGLVLPISYGRYHKDNLPLSFLLAYVPSRFTPLSL